MDGHRVDQRVAAELQLVEHPRHLGQRGFGGDVQHALRRTVASRRGKVAVQGGITGQIGSNVRMVEAREYTGKDHSAPTVRRSRTYSPTFCKNFSKLPSACSIACCTVSNDTPSR